MTQCPSKKKRISWKEKTEKQQKTNNCQHSASNIMTEQHERRQKTGGGESPVNLTTRNNCFNSLPVSINSLLKESMIRKVSPEISYLLGDMYPINT